MTRHKLRVMGAVLSASVALKLLPAWSLVR